jgi:hypothetical protein
MKPTGSTENGAKKAERGEEKRKRLFLEWSLDMGLETHDRAEPTGQGRHSNSKKLTKRNNLYTSRHRRR